jgi:hypothetical protein
VTQVEKCLPSKNEALSSNSSTFQKKIGKRKQFWMSENVILEILLGKYHYAAYYSVDAILWFTQREGSVDISVVIGRNPVLCFYHTTLCELLNLVANSGA